MNISLNTIKTIASPGYSSYLKCTLSKIIHPLTFNDIENEKFIINLNEKSSPSHYMTSFKCSGQIFNYAGVTEHDAKIYKVFDAKSIDTTKYSITNHPSNKIECTCDSTLSIMNCFDSKIPQDLETILFDFNPCSENGTIHHENVIKETLNVDALLFINNSIINLSKNLSSIVESGAGIQPDLQQFYIISFEKPEINSTLKDKYEIIPGDSIVLTCNATGNPVPVVYWTKNNETLEPKSNIVEILYSYDHVNGDYQCHAENLAGSVESSIVSVIVVEPPNLKVGNTGRSSLFGISPRKATFDLDCPFQNVTSVRWEKSLKENLNQSTLSASLEGNYTCFVENIAGSDNFTFIVFMYAPPSNLYVAINNKELTENDEQIVLQEGNPFNVACSVNDTEASKIELIKNKFEHLDINFINSAQVRIEDSGYYTCYAENTEGTNQKSFWLIVYGLLNVSEKLNYYFFISFVFFLKHPRLLLCQSKMSIMIQLLRMLAIILNLSVNLEENQNPQLHGILVTQKLLLIQINCY